MTITPIVIKSAPEEFQPFLEAGDNFENSDKQKGVLQADKEYFHAVESACVDSYKEAADSSGNFEMPFSPGSERSKTAVIARRCLQFIEFAGNAGFKANDKVHLFSAMAKGGLGKIDDALSEMHEVVNSTPGNIDAIWMLAVLLFSKPKRSPEDMITVDRYIDTAIKLSKNKKDKSKAYGMKAMLHLLDNDIYKSVLDIVDQGLKLNPKNAELFEIQALVFVSQGMFEDAVRASDLAIKYGSKKFNTFNNKAAAYLKLGKYFEALNSFDSAIEHEPNNAKGYFGKGVVWNEIGANAYKMTVKDLYSVVEKVHPEVAKFMKEFYHSHNTPEAEIGKEYIGVVKKLSQDKEKEFYDEAIKHDKAFYPPYANKAISLINESKHNSSHEAKMLLDEALSAIDAYLAAVPDEPDPEALFLKGIIHFKSENFSEAESSFGEMLKREPESLKGHIWMADTLLRRRRFESVLHELEIVTKLDPNNQMGYLMKGKILADEFGNYAKARENFMELQRLNYPNREVLYYYLAKTSFGEDKLEASMGWIDLLTDMNSDISDPYFLKAAILLKSGRHKEARAALVKAVDINRLVDPRLPTLVGSDVEGLLKDILASQTLEGRLKHGAQYCQNNVSGCGNVMKMCQDGLNMSEEDLNRVRKCLADMAICGREIKLSGQCENIVGLINPVKIFDNMSFNWFKYNPDPSPLEQRGPWRGPIDRPAIYKQQDQ